MTITQRTLRPYRSQATNERLPHDELLDGLAVHSMLGILHQLGQLSEFASEVFQGLSKSAQETGARVSTLVNRIGSLEQSVASTEQTFETTAPSVFYASAKVSSYRRNDLLTDSLFKPETQSIAMKKARAAAAPAPPLHQFDTGATQTLKKFSDPQFFLDQWISAEQERQAAMADERKKRGGKKRVKDQNPKRKLAPVQAVEVKKYSSQGMEFSDVKDSSAVSRAPIMRPQLQQNNPQQQQQQQQSVQADSSNLPSVAPPAMQGARMSITPSISSPPPPPVPSQAPPQSRGGPPPPPPPMFNQGPPPAIPAAPSMNYGAAPPPAPPAAFIPVAPPLLDDAPVLSGGMQDIPEEADGEEDGGNSGGGGGGLLSQIAGGMKQLKPAAPPPPRQPDARTGLLEEIRMRPQLKKVEPKSAAPTPAAGGGMATSIMAIMARRAAIQGSDDEDGSDDDWED